MKNLITEFELSQALCVKSETVKERAEKEMWPCKKEKTRGGYKRSYTFDLLPDDVKARLAELWVKNGKIWGK